MTSSFQDVMRGSVYSTRSDRSASLTRDREDSNATTLVPLSSESEGEDGTPLALTPTPIEELPIPISFDKSSSSEVMPVSLIVNSDELSQGQAHSKEVVYIPLLAIYPTLNIVIVSRKQ
ncbi:hypothetical protein ANCDUO_17103 [Ancylostoma duodenale]|uniref:Uncharacterized protein n=1 Tax=Ancylostoma duodenale TaxID=51022 RepID=A0A0C2C913_9BILA|nr:hypothetical protein ANCDUO_17103 [Ancylostoma duodenale]